MENFIDILKQNTKLIFENVTRLRNIEFGHLIYYISFVFILNVIGSHSV